MRLVETHRMLRGSYACLSYCWGDSEIQLGRTTRDNLSRQLDGIPFHELPDTVIDAIRLCFKLGFRFLWVDRLCILQDDDRDWSEEASRMCEVYSRSALTISTPICQDSSQSFLAERRMGYWRYNKPAVITHLEEGYKSSLCVFQDSPGRSNGPWFLEQDWITSSAWENNHDNRWLSRGWTFQEWMLSPRVLHIDTMTMWDCFEGYANELNRRYMGKSRLLRNPGEFGGGISWTSVVYEYTRRQVTHEEDRLPALAGLAARYAQATGHTYLAGLWREDLPISLLWRCERQQGPGNRCAPSWSWASVKGPVVSGLSLGEFTAMASISSVFCQYEPPGSLAVVQKGAWIDIEGRVRVVTEQKKVDTCHSDCSVKAGDEWWDALPDHGNKYPDDAIAQANVYLLLIGNTLYLRYLGAALFGYDALVLKECGWEDGRQCFERLGKANLTTRGEEVRPPEFGPSWEARMVRLV